LEHRKVVCTARETQECYAGTHRIGTGTRLGTGTGTGLNLRQKTLRAVLVIPEFKHRTEYPGISGVGVKL